MPSVGALDLLLTGVNTFPWGVVTLVGGGAGDVLGLELAMRQAVSGCPLCSVAVISLLG